MALARVELLDELRVADVCYYLAQEVVSYQRIFRGITWRVRRSMIFIKPAQLVECKDQLSGLRLDSLCFIVLLFDK